MTFSNYFFYFYQETGLDISCKLSPLVTICIKCQILFTGKNKKNINLSSTELAHRMVKVKIIKTLNTLPLLAIIVSQADNSVKHWQNLPISNPKTDFHNINAHIKFGENPLMFTQVITQKWNTDGRTDDRRTDTRHPTRNHNTRHYRVAGYKPRHYHVAGYRKYSIGAPHFKVQFNLVL